MLSETQFPFLAEKGHVVSLVGGGGKTTLLYQLSAHCARKGWRVLAATTTHIRQPDHNMAHTEAACSALWAAGEYAVLGTPDGCGKLTAPPPDMLHRWMQQADAVFLEADGAKRMPCKAPAAHEPVLLPQCDIVLAVAGVSALGESLEKGCFRAELAQQILRVPGNAVLTPTLLAKLLVSESGGKKAVGERSFYAVLNQVDTEEQAVLARQTADILKKRYSVPCILTHFEKGERA